MKHRWNRIGSTVASPSRRALVVAIGFPLAGWLAIVPAAMATDASMELTHTDSSATPAETPDDGATPKKKVRTFDTVTVTGIAPEQVPSTDAFSEGVITSDTVRNLSPGPTTTAQTMLNQQPSIFAYANGPNGVETNISFRAFNSSQFAETYAGVALNDVFNGGVTNQAENRNNVLITPNNLDSVQLYRGINHPAINSYNSLGGTINFVPRQPSNSPSAEIGFDYGSFNSYAYHATVDTGEAHGLKQIFSFEHSGSSGWIDNTGDRNNNFYWGLQSAINDSNRIANYLLYNENSGLSPFTIPVPLMQSKGDNFQWPTDWTSSPIKDTNWMDIVDWRSDFNDVMKFHNTLFFGRNEYLRISFSNPLFQQSATQPYNLEDNPFGFAFWLFYPNGPSYDPAAHFGSVENGTDYHFYGYTTEGIGDTASLSISLPHNDVVVGANITYGKLHSREYWYGSSPVPQVTGFNDAWDEHDHRTLTSVFVQDDISVFNDKLHITPGLKYIHANTSDRDSVGFFYPIGGTVSDTEHFVSPTLGFNFELAEGLNLYAAYGKNIKFPDISAYYSAFQTDGNGNPTIVPPKVKPEYVDDYELGARYRLGGFSASIDGYRENFQNTFVNATNPATQLTVFQNGGSSRYQGVELQFQNDFGVIGPGDLNAYFNYAHNQATFTSTFTSDFAGQVTAGQPLAGVPKNLVSAGVVWSWDGWRFNGEARFVDKQFIDQAFAGTPSATAIKSYTVVNVGLRKTIALADFGMAKQVKLGLNVDNVFDRRYLNTAFTDTDFNGNTFVRGLISAPRSVTGSVAIDF